MSKPIKDLDDVDDDLFISRKPQKYIFDNDLNEQIKRSMLNSRNMLQESEAVGQSTLQDLSEQREALERIENDVDNINSMTRTTQKHLNHMKSWFGGIKSLFGRNNSTNNPEVPSLNRGMPRSATIATMPSDKSASSSSAGGAGTSSTKPSIVDSLTKARNDSSAIPNTNDPEDAFEANLSEIGFGLGRLKEMAMKMGDEISDHNEMLDRIHAKTERAGDSIKHQDRQMQQLLKKS